MEAEVVSGSDPRGSLVGHTGPRAGLWHLSVERMMFAFGMCCEETTQTTVKLVI